MDQNPKSLCALEARIESLQIRITEAEESVNKAIIAFQEFAEAQTKQNKLIQAQLNKLMGIEEPEIIEDKEYGCPPDCMGCQCPNGHPPCYHCVEHGDIDYDI